MNEMTDNRSDLNKGRREKSLWIVKILGLMIVMISFQSSCSYLRPASLDYDKNIEPRPSGDIGNIVLLDRYVLIPGQGIDTEVGKIVKAGGLSIGYSIGKRKGISKTIVVSLKNAFGGEHKGFATTK